MELNQILQEQRAENPFEQGKDEPMGFIKIIPSEPIAFADKPIKITMAGPEMPKVERKEKDAEKAVEKKKSSVKEKLKGEKKPKENKPKKEKKRICKKRFKPATISIYEIKWLYRIKRS